ncbi:MAG TPA: hypothetical protein V6D10_00045 [Trichocoleus sp.]
MTSLTTLNDRCPKIVPSAKILPGGDNPRKGMGILNSGGSPRKQWGLTRLHLVRLRRYWLCR